ncbi:unnamed protein product [Chrysoparadoxa australica]
MPVVDDDGIAAALKISSPTVTPSKARRDSRSGSVVYPEAEDQGKPKLFARQSFLVSGEDEEMAETILVARKKAMERRRSVDVEGAGATAAAAAAPGTGRRDSAQLPETPVKLPTDERRRSSVMQRIPEKLRMLVQQSDENGVQAKTDASIPPPVPATLYEDESETASAPDEDDKGEVAPHTQTQRGNWCSTLVGCFRPSASEEDLDVQSVDKPEGQSSTNLLKPQIPRFHGRKLLVLDLDETLVHSSFRPVPNADYILDIQVDSTYYKVFVLKRPGVDEFLERMAELYEVVVFTASLSQYANPLLDALDPKGTITSRLFREHCVFHEGYFVKDLTMLRGNNDLTDTIIVDNSPMAYMFQPENAIDTTSWLEDPRDRELEVIGDFLAATKDQQDVRDFMEFWREGSNITASLP